MKRWQARRGNGRFVRNTPENTLGAHFNIHERKADGSWCGAFNPSSIGEPRPETCHACGELLLSEVAREQVCQALRDGYFEGAVETVLSFVPTSTRDAAVDYVEQVEKVLDNPKPGA